MILLINACARSQSRTKRLADALLERLGGPVREIRLPDMDMLKVDEAFLTKRDALIKNEKFDDPSFALAREFAAAEKIVVAAPYWDLSFPAILKQYFELINVLGVTFLYTSAGTPQGLCKAESLYYVATAGGTFCPWEYGFGYVEALARNFYGIPHVRLVKAVGLDIEGADEARIMREAMDSVKSMAL